MKKDRLSGCGNLGTDSCCGCLYAYEYELSIVLSTYKSSQKNAYSTLIFSPVIRHQLQATDTITRGQAWAARRLRIDFELGQLQQRGCVDLERGGGGGGFQPGTGPAEYVLMAFERFQAAQKALGKLFEIVFVVVVEAVQLGLCRAATDQPVGVCWQALARDAGAANSLRGRHA